MIYTIPKELKGFNFDRMFRVEMNDFDVERLLPSLFHVLVTKGRERARSNSPTDFPKYVEALQHHEYLDGFDGPEALRLLEGWLRSDLVAFNRAGAARQQEQIDYLEPVTLLVYKSGFPAEARRHRNVHQFLYRLLGQALQRLERLDELGVANRLTEYFQATFGQSIEVGVEPEYNGAFAPTTKPVDIETLLSIHFLAGLQPCGTNRRQARYAESPALPEPAEQIALDLLYYLEGYRPRLPVLGLIRGWQTLINVELFVYTLRLQRAVVDLVETGRWPAWVAAPDGGGVPIFVDFTRDRGSVSDELAKACVERDLEQLRRFYQAQMLLRTLDHFVKGNRNLSGHAPTETPGYLAYLVSLRDDRDIAADARSAVRQIEEETAAAAGNDADNARVPIEEARRDAACFTGASADLLMLVSVLAEASAKSATGGLAKWFWSVGGLRKSFGLLSGNLTGRRNWRYAMSDPLLSTLVQLAFIEPTETGLSVSLRPRLRLADFLAFLEQRFGILVDRPPEFLDSPTAREAASENLAALKRRLRQMGCFTDLADDFSAQHLRLPLRGEVSP